MGFLHGDGYCGRFSSLDIGCLRVSCFVQCLHVEVVSASTEAARARSDIVKLKMYF